MPLGGGRGGQTTGCGHLWGGVLGLTPAPRSLEDDRPAGTRSGPPPGGLLLAQPCPLPGVPVSPREDVAPCMPPAAPGHPHPCGELGVVGTVLGTWGGVLTPSAPRSPQASPGGEGAETAPQGRRGAWSAPPLPVTHPSPAQGDPTEDPAVAFVDIPGDQACAPGICIQVGGAVLPTSSTPRPQGSPRLPRAALGAPPAMQSLQPVPLGNAGGAQGAAAGCADPLSLSLPSTPACRAEGPTSSSPPPSSCATSSAVSTGARPQPEGAGRTGPRGAARGKGWTPDWPLEPRLPCWSGGGATGAPQATEGPPASESGPAPP